jgi:opacity protein-like surface antigen
MSTPRLAPTLALAAALAAPAGASAQDAPEVPALRTLSEWTIDFEPAAWYVSPGGKIRLPGTPAAGNGQKLDAGSMNLDSPRLSPLGELHLRHADWRLSASAFGFDTDGRAVVADEAGQWGSLAFSPGDEIDASLDFRSADFLVAYRFFHRREGELEGGGFTYVPMLEAHGGLRFYDISVDARGPGGSVSADRFFAEPFVGARFSMDLVENFSIDVQTSVGAFTDGGTGEVISWDALVGLQWLPTRNLGVQAGYRQLAFSLSDGKSPEKFEWRGAMAGLYVGLVLRY